MKCIVTFRNQSDYRQSLKYLVEFTSHFECNDEENRIAFKTEDVNQEDLRTLEEHLVSFNPAVIRWEGRHA